MKYLFIGEKRSDLAIKRNVRWRDGKLAAKPLFTALEAMGLDPQEQKYMNLFEPLGEQGILHSSHDYWIIACAVAGFIPVAMGRKVEGELKRRNIDHLFIYHPATRGIIRTTAMYNNHVRKQLGNNCKQSI